MAFIEDIDMTYWEEYDHDEISLWQAVLDAKPPAEMFVLTEDYAEQLFALTDTNRTYLKQWLPWVDETQRIEDSRLFIENALYQYKERVGMTCGIFYRDTLAGIIGFHTIDWANRKVEIGYWLGEAFQGKGLMTKACRAIINYAFLDLGLNKVEIRCATGNSHSNAVPKRLGFTQEGIVRQGEWLYDHFVDLILYGMLASEWEQAM